MLQSSIFKHLAMVILQSFWINFIKKPLQGFFCGFWSAFSGGWGIIINHKSHSILSLNYTEGSLNSAQRLVTQRNAFQQKKYKTMIGDATQRNAMPMPSYPDVKWCNRKLPDVNGRNARKERKRRSGWSPKAGSREKMRQGRGVKKGKLMNEW